MKTLLFQKKDCSEPKKMVVSRQNTLQSAGLRRRGVFRKWQPARSFDQQFRFDLDIMGRFSTDQPLQLLCRGHGNRQ